MIDKKLGAPRPAGSRKKLKSRVIWVCIFIALAFFAKGCFKKKPHKDIPPRPVETAIAITRDVPVYIDSFGNLNPPNDVDIKSQVTGSIKEVNFTEGVEAKEGDLLFTIDPASFQAQLDKAKAALMEDTATLSLK